MVVDSGCTSGGACAVNYDANCRNGGLCAVNVSADCNGGLCAVNYRAYCAGLCPVNVLTSCPAFAALAVGDAEQAWDAASRSVPAAPHVLP